MANELEVRIKALGDGIAADVKTLLTQDGDLTSLNTSAKNNLVAAINEAFAAAGGTTDLTVGTNNTLTLEIASSSGGNVVLNGATAALAGLLIAGDKSKLDAIQPAATANDTDANLRDRGTHTGSQLSSTISDFSTAVIAALAGDVAPAALNDINELAAALGDDENFAVTMTTALGNRVRVDAVQAFTAPQRLQACENMGIGNPDFDFLGSYVTVRDA